ncbi:MAG TPA: aldehyde dehydrogenase family protein, partial [Steroidobacteraceae bacterium]|nr:aldehyde dehydrogenase family protein [Steroidobacteraceae bacterium]
VNLVNGRGPVTGNALISHPDVDMIGFTGGTTTARSIAATAGKNLKPVALELGGKSANMIFDSASIDRALDGALAGIFGNNGQQCLAGSRILVHEKIAKQFVERFVERAQKIRLGDPLDATTEVGPLAFKAHLDRVLSYVDVARADGAKLLVGGKRAADFGRGYFMEPTAVLAPANDSRVCQEEIFGPFATFLTFGSLDEAISIANSSKFGLVSYVWSEDLHTVMRCSREIRAGTVWVNTPMMRELRAPFGGYRESGIGRDGPQASLEFFTELKSTIIPIDPPVLPKYGG